VNDLRESIRAAADNYTSHLAFFHGPHRIKWSSQAPALRGQP